MINKKIFLHITIIAFCPLFTLQAQYNLIRLPSEVNTEYDEICPILSHDEKLLFFTRIGSPDFEKSLMEQKVELAKVLSPEAYHEKLRKIYSEISGGEIFDPVASAFNQDIWVARADDPRKVYHPGPPLNNAFPNSICSQHSYKNGYVIINEFPANGGIKAGFSYLEINNDGKYSLPQPIRINHFNPRGDAVHLNMSSDGYLLVIAMRGEDSYGDLDLYISIKVTDHWYSKPKRLPGLVNSVHRESTPFLSRDKSRLYFASNRPGGYGGLDIYYSERLDYTYMNWSEPKLLPYPINSENNDHHPFVSSDENTIYFSSDREGNYDLFSANIYNDEAEERPVNIIVSIKDQKGEFIQGEVSWDNAYTGEDLGYFRANSGQYIITIEENIPINIRVSKRGILLEEFSFNIQELRQLKRFQNEITIFYNAPEWTQVAEYTEPVSVKTLDPLTTDLLEKKRIVLDNIYFVRSSPEVLKNSYSSLRQLANALNSNPEVVITIEGHTDNVGSRLDLLELSRLRAMSIKEFLIKEGIDEHRLKTAGFGGDRPIADNSNEAERKKNRRVEIIVH